MTTIEHSSHAERLLSRNSVGALAESAILLDAIEQQFALPSADKGEDGARAYYRASEGPYKFLIYPGSCTDVSEIKDQAFRTLGDMGSVHFFDYPRTYFDMQELKAVTLRSLTSHEDADRNKQTMLLTHSLGNPVADTLLMDKDIRHGVGNIARWTKDGAFTHYDQLRWKVRAVIKIGEWVSGHPFANSLYESMNLRSASKKGITHSISVSADEAERHLLSSALMPLSTRATHFAPIRGFNFPDGSLQAAGQQIDEIYVTTPEYDDVLDSFKAPSEIKRMYGKHAMLLVNTALRNEHAVVFEHPELALRAFAGEFSEDYQSGVKKFETKPPVGSIIHTAKGVKRTLADVHNILGREYTPVAA